MSASEFLAIGRFSQFAGEVMPPVGSRAWFEADLSWRFQPRLLFGLDFTTGGLTSLFAATPGCNLLDARSKDRTDELCILTYDDSSRLLSLRDEHGRYAKALHEIGTRPLHAVLSDRCDKTFLIWLERADRKNFAIIDTIRGEVTCDGSVGIREWAWIGSGNGDRVTVVTTTYSGGAQINFVRDGKETLLDEIRSFDENASRVIGFRDGTIAVLANSFSDRSKVIISNSSTGRTQLVATGYCIFVDIGLNIAEGPLLWLSDACQ